MTTDLQRIDPGLNTGTATHGRRGGRALNQDEFRDRNGGARTAAAEAGGRKLAGLRENVQRPHVHNALDVGRRLGRADNQPVRQSGPFPRFPGARLRTIHLRRIEGIPESAGCRRRAPASRLLPAGRAGAEQECGTAAAPCTTKPSLKGLHLCTMTAAATPAPEWRGAGHGHPAIGRGPPAGTIRRRFPVIQEHHALFDPPHRDRCPDGLFVRPLRLRCPRRGPGSARPVSGNSSAVKRVSGLRGATC